MQANAPVTFVVWNQFNEVNVPADFIPNMFCIQFVTQHCSDRTMSVDEVTERANNLEILFGRVLTECLRAGEHSTATFDTGITYSMKANAGGVVMALFAIGPDDRQIELARLFFTPTADQDFRKLNIPVLSEGEPLDRLEYIVEAWPKGLVLYMSDVHKQLAPFYSDEQTLPMAPLSSILTPELYISLMRSLPSASDLVSRNVALLSLDIFKWEELLEKYSIVRLTGSARSYTDEVLINSAWERITVFHDRSDDTDEVIVIGDFFYRQKQRARHAGVAAVSEDSWVQFADDLLTDHLVRLSATDPNFNETAYLQAQMEAADKANAESEARRQEQRQADEQEALAAHEAEETSRMDLERIQQEQRNAEQLSILATATTSTKPTSMYPLDPDAAETAPSVLSVDDHKANFELHMVANDATIVLPVAEQIVKRTGDEEAMKAFEFFARFVEALSNEQVNLDHTIRCNPGPGGTTRVKYTVEDRGERLAAYIRDISPQ